MMEYTLQHVSMLGKLTSKHTYTHVHKNREPKNRKLFPPPTHIGQVPLTLLGQDLCIL